MTPAQQANESNHTLRDYCLSDGLDAEFLDTEDLDERWEREGRAEMYATLELEMY